MALDSNTGEVLWVSYGDNNSAVSREAVSFVLVHEGQVFIKNDFPTLPK